MKYLYYPGCTLEGTAREYDVSTRSAMEALGAELLELDHWTCCGASAVEAKSYLLSMVLAARNLALGEVMGVEGDFLVPCSACYLNLRRVEDHVHRDDSLLGRINKALKEENLEYRGGIRVRHLMDVLATDFDTKNIRSMVKRDLTGIRVATYYGCQALRPYCSYDDPQKPRSMQAIIEALGAEIHTWEMGAKCCGAALMTTKKDVALELTGAILKAARGADCIVTVCPMCQMNLEAYQAPISKAHGEDLTISILYLPQLIGIALDLPEDKLKTSLNMAVTEDFLNRGRS